MATKFEATLKAVQNADYWMGGAVVVVDENNDYDAIPGAHLNDISYTSSRNVVIDLSNGLDDTGFNVEGASHRDIARMLLS